MLFIEVKSLAGVNFIRAGDVVAVQFVDRDKCAVVMAGGVSLPCVEPASVVAARIEAAVGGAGAEAVPVRSVEAEPEPGPSHMQQENANGDAGQ